MSTETDGPAYAPADTDTEIAAIHAVVAAVAQAQANEDVDRFAALFRADALWTTGHGKRLYGQPAIAEFTAQVLPGSALKDRVTYDVEHIVFLRPDVAAVKVRQRYYTDAGDLDSEGAPLYVMTKEHGRWMLTANQNTPVIAG